MEMTVEQVIEHTIFAIYKNNVLGKKLFLKGGQALRLKEKIQSRLSTDIDFSVSGEIEMSENFFSSIEKALKNHFCTLGLLIREFKFTRKPEVRGNKFLNILTGWAMEFKLLPVVHNQISDNEKYKFYLIPRGVVSPKIEIDISEYEYCDSFETIKVHGSTVRTYSRPLLVLEKIRALCQQHPGYPHKRVTKGRSRDFYDIERLWKNSLEERTTDALISDCRKHALAVFNAKDVPIGLATRIFETDFLDQQKRSWAGVEESVAGKLESFEYYVESLKYVVEEIFANLPRNEG